MKSAACLLSAFLLTGCAAPMFRMSALEPVPRTHDVREMARRDSASVSVAATFDRLWGEYAVFRVTIVNATASRVAIDPEGFFITLAGSPRDSFTGGERVHSAVKPEALVVRADQLLREERSTQAVGDCLGLLSLALEIADDLSEDDEHACSHGGDCSHCREAREREEDEQRERNARAAEGRLVALSQQVDFWEATVLRPCVLRPQGSADGMIAFPLRPLREFWPDRARRTDSRVQAGSGSRDDFGLVLHCPIGDSTHRLRFAVHRF